MKKIDSKQALLQDLRERIEAARVDTNMRVFDDVLSVFRLSDYSKQAGGYSNGWVGHRVDENISVPARTEGYVSPDTHHVPSCHGLVYARDRQSVQHIVTQLHGQALSAIRLTACSSWQIL
jgi:hypothetical protein